MKRINFARILNDAELLNLKASFETVVNLLYVIFDVIVNKRGFILAKAQISEHFHLFSDISYFSAEYLL